MDEEIAVELGGEQPWIEDFDIDYEFDAPRYFDLSQTETESEVREAELWFESAGSYPPSPLIPKSCTHDILWDNEEYDSTVSCCSDFAKDSEATSVDEKYNGFIYYNEKVRGFPKFTSKSQANSSVSKKSTLMKPTACLLARQNHPLGVNSFQLLRRCQRSLAQFDDMSSRNFSTISSVFSGVIQSQDTKRQKLEAGYLRKIYGVSYQGLLVHKAPKKVGPFRVDSENGRSKVTIPREPVLKTAQRAERHRSQVNMESAEHAKSKSCTSKICSVNKNIQEPSPCSSCKQSTPRRQDSRQRIFPKDDSAPKNGTMQSAALKFPDTSREKKTKEFERCKVHHNLVSEAQPSSRKTSGREEFCDPSDINWENISRRESEFLIDKSFRDEPPEELFSKLSLASEMHLDANSDPKLPIVGQSVDMIPRRYQSFHGKHCPCGSDGGPFITVNRSLDTC